jgi:hypothetical protein
VQLQSFWSGAAEARLDECTINTALNRHGSGALSTRQDYKWSALAVT